MEHHGISKLDLKRRNRMQILRVIRDKGPISRVDIASALEITRAAVTIITNEMIEEGVLYEVGEAPVTFEKLQKGRRKILIDVNANYKFVLGAVIDENGTSVGLTNLNNDILDKNYFEYDENITDRDIIDFIVKSCGEMMHNSGLDSSRILGLGIGIQPLMWSRMKVYFKDGELDFNSFSKQVSDAVGLPVICANSIGVLAMANTWNQKQGSATNHIFLSCGMQYNLAVVVDNSIMEGYKYHSNIVEKFIVNPGGRKLEGYPDGSVKAELTEPVINKKFCEIMSQEATPILWEFTGGDYSKVTNKSVALAASRGDEGVLKALRDLLEGIGVLINNVSNAYFAGDIILHNFNMIDWSFEYLKSFLKDLAGEELAKRVRISEFEGKLEFMGGCTLVILENFYKRGGL